MKKTINTLFVMFGAMNAEASSPPAVPPPPDLRPSQATTRIKERNLFHPTRGLLPPGAQQGEKDSKLRLPQLKGTLLGRGSHAALLQWPGASVQVQMEEGAVLDGIRLLKVESQKIQIQAEAGGDATWIELQPEPSKDSEISPSSDLKELLQGAGNPPAGQPFKKGKP